MNPDGALDPTFSLDGKATFDDGGGQGLANGVALQPNGRIVLAGYTSIGIDAAVLRLIGDPAPGGSPAP